METVNPQHGETLGALATIGDNELTVKLLPTFSVTNLIKHFVLVACGTTC
jgi:hypothetical protein